MMIRRCPFFAVPKSTIPSISAMIAGSFGRRASKSSATRGSPPVMSLVWLILRAVLAIMSPVFTVCPSLTSTCAPIGRPYTASSSPFSVSMTTWGW